MRAGSVNLNVRLLAFHIGLPEDFTCWHTNGHLPMAEFLPLALITDRARQNGDESYSTSEAEKELMNDWEQVIPQLQARIISARRGPPFVEPSQEFRSWNVQDDHSAGRPLVLKIVSRPGAAAIVGIQTNRELRKEGNNAK